MEFVGTDCDQKDDRMEDMTQKKKNTLISTNILLQFCFWILAFSFFHFTAEPCFAASPDAEDQIILPLKAQPLPLPENLRPGQNFEIQLQLQLEPGFKAYSDKLKVEILDPSNVKVGTPQVSPVITAMDKFTKQNKSFIQGKSLLKVLVESDPDKLLTNSPTWTLQLTYQACSESFCLFPKKIQIPLQLNPKKAEAETSTNIQSQFQVPLRLQDALKKGLLWTFLFVFVAGFLTSLTPCIFPMIPITLAILGRNSHSHSKLKNIGLAHAYVFGIALTYALLGVLAASTGALFGSMMSHPVVLSIVCLVFLLMSVSMFGLFEFQAPGFVRQWMGKDFHLSGYRGAFLSGLLAGVVASPCVGPVLVGILTYVAQTQNKVLGFWLLFTFAVGMGQLFLLLGISTQATKYLPRSGPWMNGVKFVFGSLMLAAFFYYLDLLIPGRPWDFAMGAALITLASLFGAFAANSELDNLGRVKKGFMQALFFVGIAYASISILNLRPFLNQRLISETSSKELPNNMPWQDYSEERFQKGLKSGKPIMIDFYADWCAACHELEELTFSNPHVQSLANSMILLKVNATQESVENQALREKFGIVGLPTILFFSAQGEALPQLTLTQFEEPQAFLSRLRKVLP